MDSSTTYEEASRAWRAATLPADWAPNVTTLWVLTLITAVLAIGFLVLGILITARTRSPLYLWMFVGSGMCSVLAEPLGDFVGGIYIGSDVGHLFTLFGRPMPIGDICVWVAMAPAWYLVYRMIETGRAYSSLVWAAVWFGVGELLVEWALVEFHGMLYFSNHALVLGLPVSTIAQNFGITLVGGVALHLIVPHVRGVRWLWFLTIPSSVLMAYAFATTLPSYLAIHNGASPLLGWTMGLISAYLNVAVALALIKLPSVRALRHEAAAHPDPSLLQVLAPAGAR